MSTETVHLIQTSLGPMELSVYDDRLFVTNPCDEATGTVPLQGRVTLSGSLSVDGTQWLDDHFSSVRSMKMFGGKLTETQIQSVRDTVQSAVANFITANSSLVHVERQAMARRRAAELRSHAESYRLSAQAYLEHAAALEAQAEATEQEFLR